MFPSLLASALVTLSKRVKWVVLQTASLLVVP